MAGGVMDKEYVGFAALPNQLHRKSVKKGFDFTLMVAGESGLGKSTLINSLFLTNLYEDRQVPEASARLTQTLAIERRGVEIEEGGVKVKLTLVDTPGFGDSVDCSDCWLPVVKFIEEQFEQYLRDESGLNRKNIQDSRVHCCLYFISPFGRGLRPLDVAFLRAVHEKVNIIPVIGKADALMPQETQALKQKIRDQLKEEEIHIYQFPECDSDEDEDFKRQDAEMKESIPFAVVGSCEVVRDGGNRPVRGRRYSWGTVEDPTLRVGWTRNSLTFAGPRRAPSSGEPTSLRFPEPATDAGADTPAGPERGDARSALRGLPGPLPTEPGPAWGSRSSQPQ
ncbi:septin-1 isoform X3 [Symphalangus syndactylus]|uniref:septin-1 isoform X3 n=1 Tax=Symphalangus syndactylus TaxID=9590 RepID=UPI0024430006|nr:septin-1 isoform X2 [Symphalangus syndactylus]